MRLVCPNCDAEYEVDATVIPDTGRDVQCSNCGHAWFQLPAAVEAELAAEEALFTPPPAPPPRQTVADVPTEETPAPEDASPSGQADGDETVAPDPAPVAPAARSIDESVLAVLREEAERELGARRAETPAPIETQTEMGLTPPPAAPAAADPVARRIARMKGVAPEPPVPAKPQTRREMLPEIEEINSTLRATSERRSGEAGAVSATMERPRSNGFRNGFLLMVVLATVIIALYAMAPRLAQQIPGAAPALTAYVAAVDAARTSLDSGVQWLIGVLRGQTGAN
ncbi:zinc-ribbon domain-containing protein [Tabrizicola fusiformis]|uniref:zinc-ribbon domain-containing protein n=1 Tax=Tabrizicola sp. SY72 TaxID=2741673 RepID=UPI00157415CC|nr:zinc-ribbon domain-containing protein [Tabrizicola sp. SY72]NTT84470.1 zinc-ribbon domain-containing protein [Tabrizicola sp. SY72]